MLEKHEFVKMAKHIVGVRANSGESEVMSLGETSNEMGGVDGDEDSGEDATELVEEEVWYAHVKPVVLEVCVSTLPEIEPPAMSLACACGQTVGASSSVDSHGCPSLDQ